MIVLKWNPIVWLQANMMNVLIKGGHYVTDKDRRDSGKWGDSGKRHRI